MIDLLILFAIIFVLVLINGFFVAAEFAIAAVPATRMAQLAETGSSTAASVLRILREPKRMSSYLSTVQAGITLASLGLGMYGEHAVAELLVGPLEALGRLGEALAHTIATVLAVAMLTYLHVVLGEMVPKSLALQNPEGAAIQLVGIMAIIERILRPLTVILTWLGDRVLRLIGISASDSYGGLNTASELEYIVDESHERGLIESQQQIVLENVIDFGERSVAQVMTPRTRIVAIPVDATPDSTLDLIGEARFSRYPVYNGDRDHIIGVFHVKDLARQIVNQSSADVQLVSLLPVFDLRTLLREVAFVPETMSLEKTLDLFRQRQVQIAIVIDEFGGTAGLVTLEDLAEEIVGEIRDEFDAEEIAPITQLAKNQLRVRGDLLLDELNQLYELNLDSEITNTVGGLIQSKLGRNARSGDVIDLDGVYYTVESLDRMAINTVMIEWAGAESVVGEIVKHKEEEKK